MVSRLFAFNSFVIFVRTLTFSVMSRSRRDNIEWGESVYLRRKLMRRLLTAFYFELLQCLAMCVCVCVFIRIYIKLHVDIKLRLKTLWFIIEHDRNMLGAVCKLISCYGFVSLFSHLFLCAIFFLFIFSSNRFMVESSRNCGIECGTMWGRAWMKQRTAS